MHNPKTLVVIIHGLRGNKDTVADLTKLAESCYPNSIVVTETYPHASIFATVKAAKVVRQILDNISDIYKKDRFNRLVLIGHSMGAVLARRVVIESAGIDTRWGENY